MATTKTLEGEFTWFSPVIPEEDYEFRIGDTSLLDFLPIDESKENYFRPPGNRIGPWYKLKGKRVRLTLEVMDAE